MQILYENVVESKMFNHGCMGSIFLKTFLEVEFMFHTVSERAHRTTDLPKHQKYSEDCVL